MVSLYHTISGSGSDSDSLVKTSKVIYAVHEDKNKSKKQQTYKQGKTMTGFACDISKKRF